MQLGQKKGKETAKGEEMAYKIKSDDFKHSNRN